MDAHKLTVLIQTLLDNKGAKQAKAAINEIEKHASKHKAVLKLGYSQKDVDKINAQLDKSRAKQQQLNREMSKQPDYVLTKEYTQLERAYDSVIGKIKRLDNERKMLYREEPTSAVLRRIENINKQLAMAYKNADRLRVDMADARFTDMQWEANPKKERLAARLAAERASEASLLAKKSGMYATTPWERFRVAIGKVNRALDRLIPSLRRGRKGMYDMSGGMRSTLGTTGALSRMFRTLAISGRFMIASMVWGNVFNSIRSGFTDLYNYGGKAAQSMLALKNALAGLRGSFAAAFAPILNFVAPALEKLIGLLTAAMNAVARFFAVLTGQPTYEKASFGTSGFEEAGGAAGDANKKAKEYQKTLLGFDKINKLNEEQDKSSGGGGGGGTTTEATWKEAIAKSKFADMVKKAWATDADFTEIGRMIGEKLRDALDSIDWNSIQQKAWKVGKAFATLLNGVFQTPGLAEAIGRTVSNSIETAFTAIHSFVHHLDWKSLGIFVGTTITTALSDEGMWYQAFSAIIEGFAGILEALWNAIDALNFAKIGKAFVDGLFRAIKESVETTPFAIPAMAILGAKMVNTLTKSFAPAVPAISSVFGKIAKVYVSSSKDIKPYTAAVVKDLEGTIPSAATKASTGLSVALKAVPWAAFGTACAVCVAGIISDFSKLPAAYSKNATEADKMAIEYKGSLKNMSKSNGDLVQNIKTSFNQAKSAVSSAVKSIKSSISSLAESFKSKMNAIKNAIQSAINKLKELSSAQTKGLAADSKVVVNAKAHAGGGFPEEGPFFMNRGEIAGKFGNGKGVVANNQQITSAFASAIGGMMYHAVVSGMKQGGGSGNVNISLEGDAKGLFKAVQKEANQYMQATGQPAFNL